MAESLRILSAGDPEWDRWLERAPRDFYHLSAYHAFAENAGEGRAEMAVYGTPDQFLAWPYLVRSIDGTYCDATSVYGYSGPTGLGLEDDIFRARAWQQLREAWRSRKLVTLFTRFHPLLDNDRHCTGFAGDAPVPGGAVLHLGHSVSIDLALDRDSRRMSYRQVLRQEIKRAERKGLEVALDPGWHHYPKFTELYAATMDRNHAAERYHFSRSYFDGLRQALPGTLHLAAACCGGEVAAAMLFTVDNGIAAAHFTGSDQAHSRLSPLKGLIDGVADIAAGMGASRLHLGAGRGGREDSLFAFKSRFSRDRHNFRTGRWILNREANAALSRQAPSADSGFFPAYRAPAQPRPEAS